MAHRNAEFYSQDIVFRVEDELFKVSQHLFVQHSQVFRDMFKIPQSESIGPDGSSDERPLILKGIQKQDFIQLLRFLHPHFKRQAGHGFSLDQWKSVLKLSNLSRMIEVKKLAVDYMTPLVKAESPSLQIHLAQEHDVPKWLQPAKTRLVERSDPIDENDVRLMGPTFAIEVCALRENALREKTLREKTLLEKALRESAILGTVLRENMSRERLVDNISFQKSKKSKPKHGS
ncbi:hypothetical protein M378DRAFT_23362 [Amanita muscaria Koide BX008]|uniref:BTB domain-containing protein n=1 Tax=Amanita muscaria (strain Koide BX008) TaxID=946122 RepID=A0A0C2XAN7_AMAMK|nr:hypothetical protein M378DRAFT_23362 [Amanita muscaria Koide BX008]